MNPVGNKIALICLSPIWLGLPIGIISLVLYEVLK